MSDNFPKYHIYIALVLHPTPDQEYIEEQFGKGVSKTNKYRNVMIEIISKRIGKFPEPKFEVNPLGADETFVVTGIVKM